MTIDTDKLRPMYDRGQEAEGRALISNAELSTLLDELDRLRTENGRFKSVEDYQEQRSAEVKSARLDGWLAAQHQAAEKCEQHIYALDHGGNRYRREASAGECATIIRALQPPAEWGGDG